MTDAALDIFAPLGDGPAEPLHTGTTTAAPPPDWQPETPAPEEPPAAPRHPKHGVPAAM
jgi:hypothetical protein